jgi:recombinational DNA repair ATPase RecF
MSAPARLLSVRLQGFKSFAERTLVTFGPGISAVVGPNGSGKSNLADALRGRSSRDGHPPRKAEDVTRRVGATLSGRDGRPAHRQRGRAAGGRRGVVSWAAAYPPVRTSTS